MRLRVIGCSPAFTNPGGANAGYLVSGSDGRRLLLDCGPGVLGRLRAADLLPVDAIVISHLHLDHWGDLVPWCWLVLHGPGADRPGTRLWLPPGGLAELEAFAERFGTPSMFSDAFAVGEFAAGQPFRTAGLTVCAVPVEHYGRPAFGLRVLDTRGRTLAYSGDTGPCAGLDRLADGADLLLCEATLAEDAVEPEPRGHLRASEALAAARGSVLLTHRPAELPPPPGARVAHDGLELAV